jgi:acyl dehydratase
MLGAALLSRSFDDLAVGDRQRTRGRTLGESDVISWCALTGDWFPLHSDAVYAETTRFGQRIAPGLMVLSYVTGIGVPAESQTILANYGLDRVRFVRPALLGDTIHLEAEVVGKDPRDAGSGVVTMRWDAVNQNGAPVCIASLKVLLARTDPDGDAEPVP